MTRSAVGAMLILVSVLACAGETPKIEAGSIEGIIEVRPGTYRVGEDLQMMAEWVPPHQFNAPHFFKEVVAKKYEEKKQELHEAVLKSDRLEDKSTMEGVKGCGFSLVGEVDHTQVVVEYHWLQMDNGAIKVIIMGNAKTYETHKAKTHQFLKSLKTV